MSSAFLTQPGLKFNRVLTSRPPGTGTVVLNTSCVCQCPFPQPLCQKRGCFTRQCVCLSSPLCLFTCSLFPLAPQTSSRIIISLKTHSFRAACFFPLFSFNSYVIPELYSFPVYSTCCLVNFLGCRLYANTDTQSPLFKDCLPCVEGPRFIVIFSGHLGAVCHVISVALKCPVFLQSSRLPHGFALISLARPLDSGLGNRSVDVFCIHPTWVG